MTTYLVSGARRGIGLELCRQLVRAGHRVVAVCREASDDLRSLGCRVIDGVDVTDDAAVVRLGAEMSGERIDVLINNAGGLFNHYGQTAEGIERTMATDLISPYLLTRLLLPTLKAAGSARIVNVASGGMYTQAMRADMLDVNSADYDGPTTYARAKRGLVMLAGHWARELAPWGITVHAMHPGWVDTPGLKRSLPAFHRQLAPLLRSPGQGADTIVWLAAAPDAARASGHFWLDRKIRATHVFPRTRSTPAEAAALVAALDRLSELS